MLKPIGPRAAAVYWRRRVVLLVVAFVMVVLAYSLLRPSGGRTVAAADSRGNPTLSATQATSPTQPSAGVAAAHTSRPSATAHPAPKLSRHPAAPPKPCSTSQLRIAAVTGASRYHAGDQPIVMLQVVNTGKAACVQDLADSAVELRVYNGESRVWGSHDCQVQPGTTPRTLAVGRAVLVSTTWSGLSSKPACAGQRQHVGAGTYTVYALLDGHVGTAALFSIT